MRAIRYLLRLWTLRRLNRQLDELEARFVDARADLFRYQSRHDREVN